MFEYIGWVLSILRARVVGVAKRKKTNNYKIKNKTK